MPKILAGFLLAACAIAQTASPPEFEVASIKPAADLAAQIRSGGRLHNGMTVDGAILDYGGISLFQLIFLAWKVEPYQVSGPDWMKTDRFDIIARIPQGVSKDLVPEMLRALLAQRFKLKIRPDHKDYNGYALVVARGGPNLKESLPEGQVPAPAPPGSRSFTSGNERIIMGPMGTRREYNRLNMSELAEVLSKSMSLPVVDMTELKGNYQIALDLSMASGIEAARAAGFIDDSGPPPSDGTSDPSGGPAIFQSLRKVGLALERRKVPMETIVVEHLERAPTEN